MIPARKVSRFYQRSKDNPIWLTIFSDMTTNLMLFFLMLFALTRMTFSERQMVIEGMANALLDRTAKIEADRERLMKKFKEENAIESLKTILSKGILAEYADMTIDEHTVKITLDLPVFFATGRADLNDAARDVLRRLADPLAGFENDIIIEGHTDNVPVVGGIYRSNWELSVARAVSVVNFLIGNGISPRQLISAGYGEYHPAYPNDTEANRARNRRIDISIIRQPRV